MKARSKCKQIQSQTLFFVSFRAFFIIQISNGTKNKTPEWVCSSDGRVFPSQGKGHGIDARHIHTFSTNKKDLFSFIIWGRS